jgi:hypothetical protein
MKKILAKISKFITFPRILMLFQIIVWGWFQLNGGNLGTPQYIVFCVGMGAGQIGAAIECLKTKAWGVMGLQVYFLVFTIVGAIQRVR